MMAENHDMEDESDLVQLKLTAGMSAFFESGIEEIELY